MPKCVADRYTIRKRFQKNLEQNNCVSKTWSGTIHPVLEAPTANVFHVNVIEPNIDTLFQLNTCAFMGLIKKSNNEYNLQRGCLSGSQCHVQRRSTGGV